MDSAPEGTPPQTPVVCSNCGTASSFPKGRLVLRPATAWDWRALVGIASGAASRPLCRECLRELDCDTIPVLLLDEPARAFVGLREDKLSASQRSDLDELLRRVARGPEGPVELSFCDDAQSLRAPLAVEILRHKELLRGLSGALQADKEDEFIEARWRELTPQAFAAAFVASSGLVPGIGLNLIEQSTGRRLTDPGEWIPELEKIYAQVQALVFLMVAGRDFDGEREFETTLRLFVDRAQLLPKVPSTFVKMLTAIVEGEKSQALDVYRLHAVNASTHLVAKLENPLVDAWAEIYVLFEMAFRAATSQPNPLARIRVSAERAKQSLTETAVWDAFARRLQIGREAVDRETADALSEIEKRLGMEGLLGKIFETVRVSGFKSDADIEEFAIRLIRDAIDQGKGPDTALQLAKVGASPLLERGDADALNRVFDAARDILPKDRDVQVQLERLFGEWMKLVGDPKRFLDLVGVSPRDWEKAVDRRLTLWLDNERSNSMRVMGRRAEALVLTQTLEVETRGRDDWADEWRILRRNEAILSRELGYPDQALEILLPLRAATPLDDLCDFYSSVAATYLTIGDTKLAVDARRNAVKFSKLQGARGVALHNAQLALALVLDEQAAEAIGVLQKVGDGAGPDAELVAGATWYMLLQSDIELPESSQSEISRLLERMSSIYHVASENNRVEIAIDALTLLAAFGERLDPDSAGEMWQALLDEQEHWGVPADARALASLAARAYLAKVPEKARELLGRVPDSVAAKVGGVLDVAFAAGATTYLEVPFENLSRAVIQSKADWGDVRWVSELKRDTIGRARLLKATSNPDSVSALRVPLDAAAVARIRPSVGKVAVVEFLRADDELICFRTVVDAEGEVDTSALAAPPDDVAELSRVIPYRLNSWYRGRPGDPFALDEWSRFEDWVHAEVCEGLKETDQLVVVEAPELLGIPWHVAAAAHVRCSYSPGWASLLTPRPAVQADTESLGVLSVPRHKDAETLRRIMDASVTRTTAWAGTAGTSLSVRAGKDGDSVALLELLNTSSALKLLCHGYIEGAGFDVSVALAYAGLLPPIQKPLDSNIGQGHWFSWRQCSALPRTPRLVFSGACSSGVRWSRGLGEQIGFFGALRRGGTRSVVAPRWDIVAADVIPILDDTLEAHLGGGVPLSQALHEACTSAANRGVPRWLAWSLSLEGDWR